MKLYKCDEAMQIQHWADLFKFSNEQHKNVELVDWFNLDPIYDSSDVEEEYDWFDLD